MIKVFCDRCEVEISDNNGARVISISDANVKFEKDDFSEKEGIYCKTCTELVRDVIYAELGDADHDDQ